MPCENCRTAESEDSFTLNKVERYANAIGQWIIDGNTTDRGEIILKQ